MPIDLFMIRLLWPVFAYGGIKMRECDIKASEKDVMLRSIRDMRDYTVYANDDEVGKLADILFDDEKWVVRHFVVDMDDREVLLSPIAFAAADWHARILKMNLTIEQIDNSPDINTDLPISRQSEKDYYDFYGWPYYWGGIYSWGTGMYPYQAGIMGVTIQEGEEPAVELEAETEVEKVETHLRSADEVIGYHVEAMDGSIGKVEDFIIDDACFDIKFVAIDTSILWFGKKVLLPPQRIIAVEWPERKIILDATKDEVNAAPVWDPSKPVTPAYATELQNHYK